MTPTQAMHEMLRWQQTIKTDGGYRWQPVDQAAFETVQTLAAVPAFVRVASELPDDKRRDFAAFMIPYACYAEPDLGMAHSRNVMRVLFAATASLSPVAEAEYIRDAMIRHEHAMVGTYADELAAVRLKELRDANRGNMKIDMIHGLFAHRSRKLVNIHPPAEVYTPMMLTPSFCS